MFTNEQAQATFDLVQRELGKDGGELSLIVGATILAGWVYARYCYMLDTRQNRKG